MKRRTWIPAVALGAAGAVAISWLACGGSHSARPGAQAPEQTPAATGAAPVPESAATPAPGASAEPMAASTVPSAAPAASAREPLLNASGRAGQAGTPTSSINEQLAATSKRDLDLLASFERELGQVPREAHELVRMRNAGASVSELRAWVRDHGPKELRARLVVARWLRALEADAGSGVPAAPAPSASVPKVLGRVNKKPAP